MFCLLQAAAPLAAMDSDSDLVDFRGEEEQEIWIKMDHMDNQKATDAVNLSATELESLNPIASNEIQCVESTNTVQETVGERGHHSEDCTSAGVIDFIAIGAGILLWAADISTDIYMIHKAFTQYGYYWGFLLAFVLTCSIFYTFYYSILHDKYCTGLYCCCPFLGPLGRYFILNHFCNNFMFSPIYFDLYMKAYNILTDYMRIDY